MSGRSKFRVKDYGQVRRRSVNVPATEVNKTLAGGEHAIVYEANFMWKDG